MELAQLSAETVARAALEGVTAQSAGGGLSALLPPVVFMVVIFYFLLWRPQQKQAKDHRDLLASLKKGDEVITTGGLVGKVHAVADKYLMVEVARDVRVKVLKSAVQGKAPEGTLEGAEVKAEAKAEKKD